MAIDSAGRRLPSRREIRLAAQKASASQVPAVSPDSPREFIAAAPESASAAAVTAYMPALAKYPPQKGSFSAKHLKQIRQSLPVPSFMSSLIAAGAAALSTMALVQVQAAMAAPKFTAAQSLLSEVAVDSATTPDTLLAAPGADETAKMQAALEALHAGRAHCLPQVGANSLIGALAPSAEEIIYSPMRSGTYTISSPFGVRSDPFSGAAKVHEGQDYSAPAGTPIYAIAEGTVLAAGKTAETGSANIIVIQHEIKGEVFTSWYLHMYDDGIHVAAGDKVKAGQVIAAVGSQGRSTGAHLHLEIHPGAGMKTSAVDPAEFLTKHGAVDIGSSCR